MRSNDFGPRTRYILPFLCMKQYHAQSSKGKEPACHKQADRHKRDVRIQCSLCALFVFLSCLAPAMKRSITNLTFRSILEHTCHSEACGEEHAMTHMVWANLPELPFLSLLKLWWPKNMTAVWLWQCHDYCLSHFSVLPLFHCALLPAFICYLWSFYLFLWRVNTNFSFIKQLNLN